MTARTDLVVVPFHDWRKVQREGSRTRDAHIISHLARNPLVGRVLIVNRPTCMPELLLRRTRWRTKGERIWSGVGSSLTRVSSNIFAIDTFLPDIIAPIRSGKGWFFEAYGRNEILAAIERALNTLEVKNYSLVSFNAYAGALAGRLAPERSHFDAWDNFLKFPANAPLLDRLLTSYRQYGEHVHSWSTNSAANRDLFMEQFDLPQCAVIRNGVDPEHFESERPIPADLKNMPRPIIGLGAKVTHLLDTDLLNTVVEANPDCSFVLVGQVLDKGVMSRIKTQRNFHYLGDKHYEEYPAYVRAFNVAIVPYVVGAGEHGGDAIKIYEYLAAGKPVVSTRITGLIEYSGRVFPADSATDFSQKIRMALREGSHPTTLPVDHHWSTKTEQMLRQLLSSPREAMRPSSKTIAFCGTRGLPANYGGFETAVDHISRHFVDHGYTCQVFCRRSSTAKEQAGDCATGAGDHDGRQLIYVDGHPSRKLDTFVASIQTGRHLWRNRRQYHHVLWFNNANLPGILITALAGIPMSVNTDGIEWRRAKWSWPFKLYYWLSSFLIALVCRRLVSDSHGIQQYYRRTFLRTTSFIPYGAPAAHAVSEERAGEILRRYGLEAGKYFLQITRIEPDNLPLNVAEAFQDSEPARRGYRMVFVGYKDATPYAQRLISHDGRSGVRVHEAIYDPDVLQVLRSRCFCYVHGNSVGGTNPALLEAMATCPRVIAIDCTFSREVLGDHGRYFDPGDIRPTLNDSLNLPDESASMRTRVAERYNWEAVARSYMNLVEGRPAAYNPSPAVGHRPQVRDAIEATR